MPRITGPVQPSRQGRTNTCTYACLWAKDRAAHRAGASRSWWWKAQSAKHHLPDSLGGSSLGRRACLRLRVAILAQAPPPVLQASHPPCKLRSFAAWGLSPALFKVRRPPCPEYRGRCSPPGRVASIPARACGQKTTKHTGPGLVGAGGGKHKVLSFTCPTAWVGATLEGTLDRDSVSPFWLKCCPNFYKPPTHPAIHGL